MASRILCLETATKNCSVSLFEDGKLIDLVEEGGAYSHAEKLAPFVDDILKKNNTSYQELSAIAVSKGPGSYTGLRIGVSFAKGLCYGLNLPLIAIDTLKHMAQGAIEKIQDKEALYCPMIDARRMEVYAAIYDSKLSEIKSISADIIEPNSYERILATNTVHFLGDGAAKCEAVLLNPNANFHNLSLPSSKSMGTLALEKFQSKEFEDVAYFEPFYLKDFMAIKPKKMV